MAEFTIHWFNRLTQFGATNFTLTITNNSEIIPPIRLEKKFRDFPSDTSQQAKFLEDMAGKEVELLVTNWNITQKTVEEVPVEVIEEVIS